MKIAKPNSRKHGCSQTWKGTVDSVFPLLCPVKEADWVPGWKPGLVISNSGLTEKNCIFLGPEGENEAIWIVTAYERNRYLDMYRISPEVTVSQFTITLEENTELTDAHITYEHTSLEEGADKVIQEFTEDYFKEFSVSLSTAFV